jgi:hypothetical protein
MLLKLLFRPSYDRHWMRIEKFPRSQGEEEVDQERKSAGVVEMVDPVSLFLPLRDEVGALPDQPHLPHLLITPSRSAWGSKMRPYPHALALSGSDKPFRR